MSSELIDIFDEDGRRKGESTRKQAHAKGLIHKSVLFFILDRQGSVFVNQRTKEKDFYPEYWSIVLGGHVPSGEIHDRAVLREAEEEAGIVDVPSIFITSFKKRYDMEDRENVKVYAFVVGDYPRLDPKEIKTGRFMTVGEIEEKMKAYKFLPETKDMLRILKEWKGRS